MQKKMKIYKNNIFSTVVIMLVLLCLIAVFAFNTLANTAAISFAQDCNAFNEISKNLTSVLSANINDKLKTLAYYGDILTTQQDTSPESVKKRLKYLTDYGEFLSLGIIQNGEAFATTSEYFLSKPQVDDIYTYFSNNNQNTYICNGLQNTYVYAIVLSRNNNSLQILAGSVSSSLMSSKYFNSSNRDENPFYLLDENNNVVAYCGKGGKSFDYYSIPDDLFYNESEVKVITENDFDSAESFNELKISFFNMYNNNFIENTFKNLNLFFENDSYIWYQNSLNINSNQNWKLVIGKHTNLSSDTLLASANVSLLVVVILLVFFIVIIVMAIIQGNSNRKLSKMAFIDDVTKSYNYKKFQYAAAKTLKKYRRANYAMVAFDVHKFRIVCDVEGIFNSDAVLKRISDILAKHICTKKELFARYSADDFCMMLQYTTKEDFMQRIFKLDELLKQESHLSNLKLNFGIYYIEETHITPPRMYNYACIAKESVKPNPESFIGIFTNTLRDNLLREKELESHMEAALKNEEFKVYLQPKYSTDGKNISGAEALVRWVSPELGFISPGDFIPLFENSGFIMKLDTYMLSHVCAYQKKWLDAKKELITISVNISRVHMLNPHLVDEIVAIVDSYDLPYNCIELELTESAFFDDKSVLLSAVRRLQQKGFLVSMDDFGSGYSSLNSLKDLPLDVIKLDGEFFNKSHDSKRSETVITNTILMAKNLNMKIVAEGIETKEQVDFLNKIGCDLIQGYYFAKPMPVTDFENLMGY